MTEPPIRRRRRRRQGGGPSSSQAPADIEPPRPRRVERTDHELAGAGRSQLSPGRAARARDVNRPDDDELAAAEAELTIVRRTWTPPGG